MADGTDADEQKILADLREWRDRFLAGKVRSAQLFRKPKFHDGERLAVQITHVGYAPPGGGMSAHSWLTGSSEGSAWATSGRLFVADAGKVKYEWGWADVRRVEVLPQWNGVAFDIGGEAPAMLRSESTLTQSGPARPAQVAGEWLRVEGAFAAFSGRLDAWMEALPSRLGGRG